MKEKFLKAIVLLMAAVTIFGTTSMMFSAAEISDVPPSTTKPVETTTAKPVETTTAKPVETTTAAPDTNATTATPATTVATTQEGDFINTTLVRPDRPTTTAPTTKAPTTKAPTAKPGTTKKPAGTTRRPGYNNGAPVVITTDLLDDTTIDEYTTEYVFDYDDDTTRYGYTYIDEDIDADDEDESDKKDKKDKGSVDVKKIIIIAVIVVAVVGAAVCLIILGKKQ